jgi:hypothetical protein
MIHTLKGFKPGLGATAAPDDGSRLPSTVTELEHAATIVEELILGPNGL